MKSRTEAQAFGRVLRAARLARGLTQEALAEAAEMDRTYPSLLEHGKREPSLSVLLRLARALHCAPAALVNATLALLPADYSGPWLLVGLNCCDTLALSTIPPAPRRLQAA